MFIALLELLTIVVVIVVIATQILVPAFKGGLLFPSLRKHGELEQELATATQEVEDRRLQEAVDIAKGKNAVEVANLDDLVTVIETVKSAVEAGELDVQIELASGSLKAGFKK